MCVASAPCKLKKSTELSVCLTQASSIVGLVVLLFCNTGERGFRLKSYCSGNITAPGPDSAPTWAESAAHTAYHVQRDKRVEAKTIQTLEQKLEIAKSIDDAIWWDMSFIEDLRRLFWSFSYLPWLHALTTVSPVVFMLSSASGSRL